MRSPSFALLLALCASLLSHPGQLAAQTVQTHVLPNYVSRFGDNYTQQIPSTSASNSKGDIFAVQWLLFPNPVKDAHFALNLDLVAATDLEVNIFSANGLTVAQQNFSDLPSGLTTLDFEITDFPSGTYYLSVRNGTGAITIAFVVAQ